MADKRGTAWIQTLNKREIIDELQRRGIEASDESKLEDLRWVLRKDCKSKGESEEGTANPKAEGPEQSNDSEVDEVREETGREGIATMEYTAKLDFALGTDEWEEFVERIELYFEANGIEDGGKQRAILLMKIDAETYSVVRKVCAPKKPKETELKDIITRMGNYLKPKVNETVLRQQFRERRQKENESATQYIACLRSLARNCKFKDEDEALRDQLITGIGNKAIKVALFKIENLTLDDAIRTATAIEGANKAAETLEPQTGERGSRGREEDAKAHRTQTRGRNTRERRTKFTPRTDQQSTSRAGRTERQQQSTSRLSCSCCGKPGHHRRNCWHQNKQCDTCGKTGHLQAVCETEKTGKGKKNVRNVETEKAETDASETESDLFSITLRNNKISKIEPQYLEIRVENKSWEMEIDGGSSVSIISEIDKERYFPQLRLEEAKVTLSYYSGEKRKPLGILCDIRIEFGDIATKADLYVVGKTGNR